MENSKKSSWDFFWTFQDLENAWWQISSRSCQKVSSIKNVASKYQVCFIENLQVLVVLNFKIEYKLLYYCILFYCIIQFVSEPCSTCNAQIGFKSHMNAIIVSVFQKVIWYGMDTIVCIFSTSNSRKSFSVLY